MCIRDRDLGAEQGHAGQRQGGEEGENGARAEVVDARALDQRPQRGPGGRDGEHTAPPRQRQAQHLARLGLEAPGDQQAGGDEADQEDAGEHQGSGGVPCAGHVHTGGGVEIEERGDEQQRRCSDHHAVASSEGADVHVLGVLLGLGRLVVPRSQIVLQRGGRHHGTEVLRGREDRGGEQPRGTREGTTPRGSRRCRPRCPGPPSGATPDSSAAPRPWRHACCRIR